MVTSERQSSFDCSGILTKSFSTSDSATLSISPSFVSVCLIFNFKVFAVDTNCERDTSAILTALNMHKITILAEARERPKGKGKKINVLLICPFPVSWILEVDVYMANGWSNHKILENRSNDQNNVWSLLIMLRIFNFPSCKMA